MMKMDNGWISTSREFGGNKLFIVLLQSYTEGEWLSLTVQHI